MARYAQMVNDRRIIIYCTLDGDLRAILASSIGAHCWLMINDISCSVCWMSKPCYRSCLSLPVLQDFSQYRNADAINAYICDRCYSGD